MPYEKGISLIYKKGNIEDTTQKNKPVEEVAPPPGY